MFLYSHNSTWLYSNIPVLRGANSSRKSQTSLPAKSRNWLPIGQLESKFFSVLSLSLSGPLLNSECSEFQVRVPVSCHRLIFGRFLLRSLIIDVFLSRRIAAGLTGIWPTSPNKSNMSKKVRFSNFEFFYNLARSFPLYCPELKLLSNNSLLAFQKCRTLLSWMTRSDVARISRL